MNYMGTDKLVRVGDNVLYHGDPAVIVFLIDDDSYSDRYPKEHWSYLGKGVGVEVQGGSLKGTLFHLNSSEEEEDLERVSPAADNQV